MSTLSEKLAAARAARPSRDVKVLLDGELAEERDRLLAELESAGSDDRLGVESAADEIRARLDALTETAKDAVEVLRFTRLPGRDWTALTSKHPVRVDVPIDRQYGYNYDAVCEAAAQMSGVRIVDGEPVALIVEERTPENPNPVNEWAELFDVLSGSDVGEIRDAIWALNEWEPQQRLATLVKGFGAAQRSDNM